MLMSRPAPRTTTASDSGLSLAPWHAVHGALLMYPCSRSFTSCDSVSS